MAVPSGDRVDDPSEVFDSGQAGRPRQPTPAVKFGENPPPGVESRLDGPVREPDVDCAHHGVGRSGGLIGAGIVEVDETQPTAPISN